MTRTLKTIMAVCLGTILLTSVACENKETEAALKTCRSDLGNEQKRANDQQTTINALKAQLATAQTKIDEMTKSAAKPDEKAKAGEAKKDEPAKAAASDKKGKKK
jgi:predicted  nucleic acid-binding Zn-ribbon protein